MLYSKSVVITFASEAFYRTDVECYRTLSFYKRDRKGTGVGWCGGSSSLTVLV